MLSLISHATTDGYDVVFRCAQDVIDTNKEMEEKQKLLQSKIKELELLFQHETLDKLKEISFIDNGTEKQQEPTTGIKLVEEGSGEGPEGDSEPEEEDD